MPILIFFKKNTLCLYGVHRHSDSRFVRVNILLPICIVHLLLLINTPAPLGRFLMGPCPYNNTEPVWNLFLFLSLHIIFTRRRTHTHITLSVVACVCIDCIYMIQSRVNASDFIHLAPPVTETHGARLCWQFRKRLFGIYRDLRDRRGRSGWKHQANRNTAVHNLSRGCEGTSFVTSRYVGTLYSARPTRILMGSISFVHSFYHYFHFYYYYPAIQPSTFIQQVSLLYTCFGVLLFVL